MSRAYVNALFIAYFLTNDSFITIPSMLLLRIYSFFLTSFYLNYPELLDMFREPYYTRHLYLTYTYIEYLKQYLKLYLKYVINPNLCKNSR